MLSVCVHACERSQGRCVLSSSFSSSLFCFFTCRCRVKVTKVRRVCVCVCVRAYVPVWGSMGLSPLDEHPTPLDEHPFHTLLSRTRTAMARGKEFRESKIRSSGMKRCVLAARRRTRSYTTCHVCVGVRARRSGRGEGGREGGRERCEMVVQVLSSGLSLPLHEYTICVFVSMCLYTRAYAHVLMYTHRCESFHAQKSLHTSLEAPISRRPIRYMGNRRRISSNT